jgi:hypothetical protein
VTVFRCRECGTVHDSFQALADCCDPLTGGDDDPGSAPPLVADGGTRSRRAERATDRGQSSLREHVRSNDTLAGVGDQDDDECPNGEAWCPGPAAVRDDELPCFECFLEAGDDDVDRGDGAVTDGGVDLPNDAHRVDPEAARDAESTAFARARDEPIVVDAGDGPGHYRVRVGDGDVHRVALVEDQESHVGRCDCDGFNFHAKPGGDGIPGGACAHLCAVVMDSVVGSTTIPTVDGHAADPLVGDVDAEVVEHAPAGDQEASDDVDEATAATPARAAPATPTVDEDAPDDLDEFVTDVAGVPSVFVVDMGRGRDSKPYVTKEGLTYIARKAGIQVSAEPLSPTWEGDADVAAYRGVAVDDDGRRYEDVATAHADQVENTVGRENLDELASTRATNRALRLATGCGFASVEELDADAAITPGAEADVVDDEVATDGGRR